MIAVVPGANTNVVGSVLNADPFRGWMTAIDQLDNVLVRISEQPAADFTPKLGKTVVTEIDAKAVEGAPKQEEWRQRLAASLVTIDITIMPNTSQDDGDVKATLMHELVLHLGPMLNSLLSLKAYGPGAPAANEDRARLFAHVTNIVVGEDMQHAEYQSWIAYLSHAVTIGNADKAAGGIKMGSDLIMSAVNDAMSHAKFRQLAPLMSEQARSALFEHANRIGTAEGKFRDQHPEIWGSDDDSPPSTPVGVGNVSDD